MPRSASSAETERNYMTCGLPHHSQRVLRSWTKIAKGGDCPDAGDRENDRIAG